MGKLTHEKLHQSSGVHPEAAANLMKHINQAYSDHATRHGQKYSGASAKVLRDNGGVESMDGDE